MSSKADYDFYKSIRICVRCHKRAAEQIRLCVLNVQTTRKYMIGQSVREIFLT